MVHSVHSTFSFVKISTKIKKTYTHSTTASERKIQDVHASVFVTAKIFYKSEFIYSTKITNPIRLAMTMARAKSLESALSSNEST